MKKISSLLLSATMLFGLAACQPEKTVEEKAIDAAHSYFYQLYKDEEIVSSDISRLTTFSFNELETPVTATWAVEYKGSEADPEMIKLGSAKDDYQSFAVKFNYKSGKSYSYDLKVTFTLPEVEYTVSHAFTVSVPELNDTNIKTIKDFKKSTGNVFVHAYVLSDADSYTGYIIGDATGSLYTYSKVNGVKKGDEVWLLASYKEYNKLDELGGVPAVLKVNSNANLKQMPLKVVNVDDISTANAYDNDMVAAWKDKLIKVSGKLVIDGSNYYLYNTSDKKAIQVNNPSASVKAKLNELGNNANVTFFGYSAGNGKGFQKLFVVEALAGLDATDPFTHF